MLGDRWWHAVRFVGLSFLFLAKKVFRCGLEKKSSMPINFIKILNFFCHSILKVRASRFVKEDKYNLLLLLPDVLLGMGASLKMM